MQIDVIKDRDLFYSLREEWHELLACSATNSIFLSWEWMYSWWEFLSDNRELHIVTVRGQGRLLAIVPFVIKPFRWRHYMPFRALEFLGMGNAGSDYLDLIIRGGEEPMVLPILANYFAELSDILILSQTASDSNTAKGFTRELVLREWTTNKAVTDVCPYIKLNGHSWDSYVSSLGRSHRQNFQRKSRQMEKQFKVDFEQALTEGQRIEAMKSLFTLHNDRRKLIGGSNALHTDALCAFHDRFSKLALENGWLRLFTLKLDDHAASSLYGFRFNNVFYFYQSGFDTRMARYSPGLVTMGLSIKAAIAEGITEYDMLHGEESYKYLWAEEKRELLRLMVFPSGIKGRISKQVLGMRQGVKQGMKRLVVA